MLAALYAELGRPPKAPLATIEQTLVGIDTVQLDAWFGAAFDRFDAQFPFNAAFPGPRQASLNGIEGVIKRVIALLEALNASHAMHFKFMPIVRSLASEVVAFLATVSKGLAPTSDSPLIASS